MTIGQLINRLMKLVCIILYCLIWQGSLARYAHTVPQTADFTRFEAHNVRSNQIISTPKYIRVTSVNDTARYLSDEASLLPVDVQDLVNKNHYRPNLPFVFWLHIEKTSSWFDNLLAIWGCTSAASKMIVEHKIVLERNALPVQFNYWSEFDQYFQKDLKLGEDEKINMLSKSYYLNCSVNFVTLGTGFGYHMPYNDPSVNRSIVTMFRNPTDRLATAFLYDIMIPQGSPLIESVETMERMREEVRQSSNPIYAYSQVIGIASCQTKMIIGHACGAAYNITHEDLIEAKRRLREDVLFFGISEEPIASANLFLTMFRHLGGNPNRTNILDRSFYPPFNFRPGRSGSNHNRKTHHKTVKDLAMTGWKDYYDEELYKEAVRIFHERCDKYNIVYGKHHLAVEPEQSIGVIDVSELRDPTHYRPYLPFIFWLHIEKTSSWIDNLLAMWACPAAALKVLSDHQIDLENNNLPYNFNYFSEFEVDFEKQFGTGGEYDINMITKSYYLNCSVNFVTHGTGFGYHTPYMYEAMKGSIVTLFRKPIDRIISAYMFDLMIPQGSPFATTEPVMEAVRLGILNSSNPIYAYSQTQGIPSCQTKMLLGQNCGSDYTLTRKDLDEAKRRLREDLYFFGLTEESIASANLFLAMHHEEGGFPNRTNIYEQNNGPPFNFRTNRINRNHNHKAHQRHVKDLLSAGWKDEYDEELYKEASRIFYERCQKYSIETGQNRHLRIEQDS